MNIIVERLCPLNRSLVRRSGPFPLGQQVLDMLFGDHGRSFIHRP
ncbi:hypothetical protein [Rubripirellula tenax]|nr:hypothetical protein [Rubripirellula tenax]